MVWTFIRKVSSWKLSKFFLITCKRKKRTRAYGPLSTSVIVYKERHIAPVPFDFICESHEHSSSQPWGHGLYTRRSAMMPMRFHFEFPFSQIPPPPSIVFSNCHTEYYWGYSFLAMHLYFYNFSSFLWRKKQDKKGEEADGAGGGDFVSMEMI